MNRRNLAAGTSLALLLLCAWAVPAAAESYWGFQGGINFASMGDDFDDYADYLAEELGNEVGNVWTASAKGRSGFVGGLTYALMYNEAFGFQVEGMYVSRGGAIDLATGGVQAKADLDFNYLEIPVMLRWAPTHGHPQQVVFLLGPTVGFKLSPKASISGINAPDMDGDIDTATSTVFGLTGVVVLRKSFNEKTALQLQARYYNGFTSLVDHDELTSTAKDFMLMAGMEFTFGK